MAGSIRVREQARDDELGIIRKKVVLPDGFEFESPSRSIARSSSGLGVVVNEIPRQITPDSKVGLAQGPSDLLYAFGPKNHVVYRNDEADDRRNSGWKR